MKNLKNKKWETETITILLTTTTTKQTTRVKAPITNRNGKS